MLWEISLWKRIAATEVNGAHRRELFYAQPVRVVMFVLATGPSAAIHTRAS